MYYFSIVIENCLIIFIDLSCALQILNIQILCSMIFKRRRLNVIVHEIRINV